MEWLTIRRLKQILSLMAVVTSLTGICAGAETMPGKQQKLTDAMVERSFLSAGNTERFHKAVAKAQNGEKVTIAYLGGSITEGALAQPQPLKCYAYLSAHLFAEKYMPDAAQLNYINAGVSGTPSLLGITRLEQDVLRHQPDIVFVEFAVNDSGDLISQGVYESLLRKLLLSETQPAVILLFTVLSGGHSCQEHMSMLGRHYKLGMISVKDAIWPDIQQGTLAWSDYSSDYAHPTTEGHAFITDMIGYYFDQAMATAPEPYELPRFVRISNQLEELKNIRHGDERILSTGGFPYAAVSCYTYRSGWWHKGSLDGNDPMVIQAEGSCMTVAFKQMKDENWGTAEVWVDGQKKADLSGYSADAWGNVQSQLITFSSKGGHTLEIRMADGDENKIFQLLDVAIAP